MHTYWIRRATGALHGRAIGNALLALFVVLFAVAAAIVTVAAHAQTSTQAPTPTQAQTPNAIVIRNFMFSPMALTVKAGSTVTWKNLDGEPHTVVNAAGLFRSAALDQNDTYQFRFDKPGVYQIFCGIHPNMKATVTVQ